MEFSQWLADQPKGTIIKSVSPVATIRGSMDILQRWHELGAILKDGGFKEIHYDGLDGDGNTVLGVWTPPGGDVELSMLHDFISEEDVNRLEGLGRYVEQVGM